VEAAHYARLAAANPDQCSGSPLASDEHCPGVWFDGLAPAEDEDIYVIVRHRNHLDIMSAQPVAVDAVADVGIYAYDFSASVRSAANNSLKVVIGPLNRDNIRRVPVAVVPAGDINGDGRIFPVGDLLTPRVSDVGMIDYHVADFNLNGTVHIEDFTNYVSSNLGTITGIPPF